MWLSLVMGGAVSEDFGRAALTVCLVLLLSGLLIAALAGAAIRWLRTPAPFEVILLAGLATAFIALIGIAAIGGGGDEYRMG